MRGQWPARRHRLYLIDAVTQLKEVDARCLDISLVHEQVFATAVGPMKPKARPRLYAFTVPNFLVVPITTSIVSYGRPAVS